jgi:hypothetical protein
MLITDTYHPTWKTRRSCQGYQDHYGPVIDVLQAQVCIQCG